MAWAAFFGRGGPRQPAISGRNGPLFAPPPVGQPPTLASVKNRVACPRPRPLRRDLPFAAASLLASVLLSLAAPAVASDGTAIAVAPAAAANAPDLGALEQWAAERAGAAAGDRAARVEVELGRLDPRLRLAPCARIDPFLPTGARLWGRSRVGLRCADGPTRWTVYLPLTVRVLAAAPVLRDALPAGTTLTADHLADAEVDWAERADAPIIDPAALLGHELARALPAGAPLREADLRQREWFAAGERVRITAVGPGFRVSTEGQALARGIDGRSVRVRTDAGRVVSGTATGAREVELAL
jgi:flagella basal body P-ring formation protein FlgA